jgi:hypothetical protein
MVSDMTPTPCMMDCFHGDSFPYPTYATDALAFAQMVAGKWPFLMHKGAQGSLEQDTKVVGRLSAAAGVLGLSLGIYHFMDDSPIHQQIGNFMGIYAQVSAACPKGTFLRLAVDNEPTTLGLAVTAQTDAMANMMAQAMYMANGRRPLIYGDASEFYSASAKTSGFMNQCPRWLAKYGPWATSMQCGPGWTNWQWQQFSDGGENTLGLSVPGFAGKELDMSAFAGSLAEAVQAWAM